MGKDFMINNSKLSELEDPEMVSEEDAFLENNKKSDCIDLENPDLVKSFKIKKIERYDKKLSSAKQMISLNTVLLGLTSAATMLCVVNFAEANQNIAELAWITASTFNLGLSTYHLKNLISEICKKTMYKNKIDTLCDELEFEEYLKNNQEKVMKK